jgi:hypothetical protein
MPTHPGDFGIVWFGGRALLRGINPYPLVGPGLEYDWPWLLLYPATAMVTAIPLAPLTRLAAILIFVFASCALLAFALTKDGWYRMPLFLCAPFIVAAGAAQWSPLFTAAIGIPALAIFFAAKPPLGLALALSGDRSTRIYAVGGGLVLTAISLAMFPGWPAEWMRVLQQSEHIKPPALRLGGFVVLLALIKWRRADARLIVAMALVPQTAAWYEALPLFLVCATRQQTMILGMLSSIGYIISYAMLAPNDPSFDEVRYNDQVGALMIALVYLPAVIMVLRRPNERSGFFRTPKVSG